MKARPTFRSFVAMLFVAGAAGAEPATSSMHASDYRGVDRVQWHPRRELSFGLGDVILTGTAVVAVGGGQVLTPSTNHWRGGVFVDEDVRDALRISNVRGRYAARDASDVGVSLASTWPFLVDALVTAWWYRGRSDVARNMALVSAEAFAISTALQGLANQFGSRERPFGRLCGKDLPENSVDCEPDVRYRSFFSGHATLAFTSAGLLCSHHLGLGLLGTAGDIITCVAGETIAVMTSVFRIMSDMHYASDVGLGALVGTAVGVSIPLLHMGESKNSNVRVGPAGPGLGVTGVF